jgi:hypothetical protein
MANTLATPTWVTKEVARGFVNELKFAANVNRSYDDQYEQAGAKVGNTVNARLPQRFTVTDGQGLQLQSLYDQTVPITLTNQKNVAFGYSSAQATTELNDIRTRYVQPGAEALANAVDVLGFNTVVTDIYNSVIGTIGTTPSTVSTYLQAGTKLTDTATPMSGRVAVLDPLAMQTIAGATATLFNPSAVISENYKSGMFGRNQLGIDEWYQDPNKFVLTTSTLASSTPAVNGASQTGSSLITDGWAANATLKRGEVITLALVDSVNPLSYQDTGRLQQFVITANVTADGSGNMTIPISPSIITSGQLQSVTGSPADNAAIYLNGTSSTTYTQTATNSPQSLVYHPDAFALVMADLVKPGAGATATTVKSKALGFSIRMVEQYQIATDQNPSRLDILIGWATLQPRLACRVWG